MSNTNHSAETPRTGYKVFEPDFTCRKHQFSENSEHTVSGKPKLCSNGFHFCPKPNDCFEYYSFTPDNIVCEVEALGEVDYDGGDKACTVHIKIGRRLSWHEVLERINQGKGNTGRANTGSLNTGDRNTGDRNTGDRNTGDRNTGDWNTGNLNTGDLNTGSRNTGSRNTGSLNTGSLNTGRANTGDLNTGSLNTGDRNTGGANTGSLNTGSLNTGDRNTGDWNTGNLNTGVFCEKAPETLLFFDKPSDMTPSKWANHEAKYLMYGVRLTEWVSWSDMTPEQKEQMPRAETQDGYLKQYTYEQAHQNWWNNLDARQRKVITSLPNFDSGQFKRITGIDINA